jgi:hypothetical protein
MQLIKNLKFKIMKNLRVKTIILIAAIGLISYSAMAQKAYNNVPQAVLTAFSAKYPQAQLKGWKTKDNTCIAKFVMNNKKYKASYSNDGNWLNTVRNIRHTSSLPDQARLYLKKSSYASWHIDNMQKLATPIQNMYQVEVDNASGNKILYEDAVSFEDKMLALMMKAN